MSILIACEESQAVTKEFRKLGIEAYSCDLLECSGNHPEWHIQGDVLKLIDLQWDAIIAFPPCTYLTVTGNRWFNVERYGKKAIERAKLREDAKAFFMQFVNADCKYIAIENPIGVMSTAYRKPDQIIQPYMFGDCERKSTCLWLKNLPCLEPIEIVKPNIYIRIRMEKAPILVGMSARLICRLQNAQESDQRRFPGIARAMATQWAGVIYG